MAPLLRLLLITSILLTVGCPQSPTTFQSDQTIRDATGAEVPQYPRPRRIISLAPELTRLVYQLGVGHELVGRTSYCPLPPSGKDIPIVGTLLRPNLEKVVQLRPDLILATKEGNSPKGVDKLRHLGYRVFVADSKNSFRDIAWGLEQLGRLLGREERVEEVLGQCRKRLAVVAENLPPPNQRPLVFFEIWGRPLMTAAGDSFHHDMIHRGGGRNLAHRRTGRYPKINPATVVQGKVEVIFILASQGDPQERVDYWLKFSTLPATVKKRIYILPKEISIPTPNQFARGVELIHSHLYPKGE